MKLRRRHKRETLKILEASFERIKQSSHVTVLANREKHPLMDLTMDERWALFYDQASRWNRSYMVP